MSKGHSPWDDQDGAAADLAERPVAPVEPVQRAVNPWLVPDKAPAPRRAPHAGAPPPRSGMAGPIARRWAKAGLRWLGAVLVIGAFASTSLHVLKPGEAGIVTTLGRHTRTLGPGLAATLPWPIESLKAYNVGGLQTASLPFKDGENPMLTRDGQLIAVAVQVRWQITDLRAYATALKDPETAIRDLADAELRAAVAEETFDPVWSGTTREAVAGRARQRMQAVLDAWRAGVRIERIEIASANPPSQLSEVFQKAAAARDEARQHREQAEEWAARTLNNARAEAQDFDRIYLQYRAAPDITRRRMYYETMERVITNNDRVVVGGGAGTQVVLPQAGAPVTPPVPPPAPPQAAPPAQPQGGK